MKKILLSAAALSVLTAGAAQAEDPVPASPVKLELGGFMTWYGSYANQKRATLVDATGAGTLVPINEYNAFDIMGNAEIYFSGKAELDNGMTVGVMVQLEAGTDPATSSKSIDETYLTLDTKAGRFIVGNVKSTAAQMSVLAPTVSTIGQQDSDWSRMITVPYGFSAYSSAYSLVDDISTKISYITPTFNGFTAGFSVMPGNDSKGQDDNNLLFPISGKAIHRDFKQAFSAVGLYEGEIGGFDISSSISYSSYKPNPLSLGSINGTDVIIREPVKTIKEYAGGLNIGMGNWVVGGSYRYVDAAKTSVAVMQDDATGYMWDAGVSYSFGPFETSLNYLHSRKNNYAFDGKDEYNLYQIAGNYKLGAGVDTFINVAYVEYESADKNVRGKSNEGLAVATGMNLSF